MSEENKSGGKPLFYIRVAALLAILAIIGVVYFHPNGGSFGLTSVAQEALNRHIVSDSGGEIRLADFQKTNGQTTKAFGVEGYNLQFEGDITFTSDGLWLTHNPMAGGGLTFSFSKTSAAFGGLNGETQVHAGGRVKIAGTMTGQKSERGWDFSLAECHIVSRN